MAQLKVRKSGAWVIPSDIKLRNSAGGWDGERNGMVRVSGAWEAIMTYWNLRIYGTRFTDYDWLMEMDPETGLRLKYVASPTASPSDIGGLKNRVFHAEGQGDKIYEVDPETLATTQKIDTAYDTRGIGGMDYRLFYGSYSDNLREYDPDTLLVLNVTNSLTGSYIYGVGGTSTRLFRTYANGSTYRIYELDPDTFVVLNTVTTSSTVGGGKIGGGRTRLFLGKQSGGIYEIDPDTFVLIENIGGSYINGIGGMK